MTTTVLSDQFGRTAFISGSIASPTGGTWSLIATAHDSSGGSQTNGTALVLTGSSGDALPSYLNSAAATTIEASVSVTFTPTTDGWNAGVIFHGDSDGYPMWIANCNSAGRRISRINSAADGVSTNIIVDVSDTSIAAGNRSAHTLQVDIAANGDLSITVDGTPVSLGGTINDATLTTAGRFGIFGRGSNFDNLLATDAAASGPVITGPLAGGGLTHSTLTQGRLAS